MRNRSSPPVIEDYEVYDKIKSAKKPKSGVPGDLPCRITKEFAPELAKPVGRIIISICRTIGKIPIPETEDDLRPISLTPFFSKVREHL